MPSAIRRGAVKSDAHADHGEGRERDERRRVYGKVSGKNFRAVIGIEYFLARGSDGCEMHGETGSGKLGGIERSG